MDIWKYIKADNLFADLLPEIKNYNRKMIGSNTKGAPLSFTDDEQKAINEALKQIPDLYYWHYIKADPFFADFLPEIKNHKLKIRGKNTRGNPLDFTEVEFNLIKNAIRNMIETMAGSEF